ncbi:PHP domain-containing protein [Streptomyces sp. WAC01280]|uniref:PHP domain-containing protein n=1 Tax=Streptomyces sp. WAC01280 TaxID=2487424 RepID=UPI000F7AAAF5|nr:PHP domain-containing protein [Streptomyces sp. WAC01280]RSS51313.1 PHP domain-containing protein [Streptomyces sp. WAC01280]
MSVDGRADGRPDGPARGPEVDLHIHTHFSSDADHSPAEVLEMAAARGLRAVAIADHDVIAGSAEALGLAAAYGVEVVPCVELTTFLGGREFHVLGYFVDPGAKGFTDRLAEVQRRDEARARALVEALVRLGVDCTYDEARALTPRAVPKCSVVVRAAMTNGRNDGLALFDDYREGGPRAGQPYHNFFLDHMRPGGTAYVESDSSFSTVAAVELVREYGGVSVLAHPGGSLPRGEGTALLDELRAAGLDGMEVFSPYHSDEDVAGLSAYCEEAGLVRTAGSDFHGETVKPGLRIGGPAESPYAVVEQLRERAERRSRNRSYA